MMKILALFFLVLFLALPSAAGERELMDLAKSLYDRGEYYSAITEIKRCGFLYPDGKYLPAGRLLMGKSYLRGGNPAMARLLFRSLHERYPLSPEGEEGLFSLGCAGLSGDRPDDALAAFQDYGRLYPSGRFSEAALRHSCYAAALDHDLLGSLDLGRRYLALYPEGRYLADLKNLGAQINEELNRPRKSILLSVAGSLVFPGFGHFYTGRYGLGLLSLATNALCGFLVYNGYRHKNTFQMVFFSLVGASFYQYNLVMAVRDVQEYNSGRDFSRRVKLGIGILF